jgi:hypothetical protein
MILDPKVLTVSSWPGRRLKAYNTPPEDRPRRRPRIIGVPIRQSGIGSPHDSLQFPELGKEAWSFVVDFWCVERYYKSASTWLEKPSFKKLTLSMVCSLDVP